MRILLLHTAGSEGSVALADTETPRQILALEVLPGRTSSELLVSVVRRMLETNGLRLNQLAAIAVVHGPGSFTGIRVGLSAAKGLSEAGNIPLIAISRLALLAAKGTETTVHAVLDAGRGEFYYGEYTEKRLVREALLSGEAVLEAILGEVPVVCETKTAEVLSRVHPFLVEEPKAEEMLPLVLERITAGEFDNTALIDANYLRRTDLEIAAKMQADSVARA